MYSLVSILIPVYNRESLVGESIESALKQSYENIEIIVVDNCSTDKTWKVLERYAAKDSRIKIFQNSENVGPVLNWQRCIAEAKGEYAKILFSDDLISENFVGETIKLLDEDTAFVLSNIKMLKNEKVSKVSIFKKDEYSVSEYLNYSLIYGIYGFPVSPACAMFRTQNLKEGLMINIPNQLNLDFKTYGAGNDLLIFLLTAVRYKKIRIAANAVTFFRHHSSSFSVGNNLILYYDFAKFYFISNYAPQYMSKFKYSLIYRKKRFNINSAIIDLLPIKYSKFNYMLFVFNKFFKALQRRLF